MRNEDIRGRRGRGERRRKRKRKKKKRSYKKICKKIILQGYSRCQGICKLEWNTFVSIMEFIFGFIIA
jgi:hypothetical protein